MQQGSPGVQICRLPQTEISTHGDIYDATVDSLVLCSAPNPFGYFLSSPLWPFLAPALDKVGDQSNGLRVVLRVGESCVALCVAVDCLQVLVMRVAASRFLQTTRVAVSFFLAP